MRAAIDFSYGGTFLAFFGGTHGYFVLAKDCAIALAGGGEREFTIFIRDTGCGGPLFCGQKCDAHFGQRLAAHSDGARDAGGFGTFAAAACEEQYEQCEDKKTHS